MDIERKIKELVEEYVAVELSEKERELELEYENILESYQVEYERVNEWIELPDYPLMQSQKDAINRAIQMVLSGELIVD